MRGLLLLTYEEDPHADAICARLDRRTHPYLRINTEKFNREVCFGAIPAGEWHISVGCQRTFIDQDWTIWNRRILESDNLEDLPTDLQRIVIDETRLALEGLLNAHPGRVVNRPRANQAANCKLDQLRFASQNGGGVRVPQTLYTNDPNELEIFASQHLALCVKPQKPPLVIRDGQTRTTYTNVVTAQNLAQAALIARHPHVFQEYIPKRYELRITALEHRAIGIAIHSQDSPLSQHDYRRYDFERVRYEYVDLPNHVQDFCQRLLAHYDLAFGEIDMILTPDNEYVFLELNPNGQWLWLQEQSGYDLANDLLDTLLR